MGLLFSCITVSSLISFFLFCSIFKYENGTAYVFIEHTYTGRLKKIHIYKFWGERRLLKTADTLGWRKAQQQGRAIGKEVGVAGQWGFIQLNCGSWQTVRLHWEIRERKWVSNSEGAEMRQQRERASGLGCLRERGDGSEMIWTIAECSFQIKSSGMCQVLVSDALAFSIQTGSHPGHHKSRALEQSSCRVDWWVCRGWEFQWLSSQSCFWAMRTAHLRLPLVL